MGTKQRLFEIISNIDPKFNVSIKKQLLSRIPFFKEYSILENSDNRIVLRKLTYNSNVKTIIDNNVINFKNYNLFSEFVYYKNVIRDNTFHNFILNNKFYFSMPDDVDTLTKTVYIRAIKLIENKLSYNKEIVLNSSENFDPMLLTDIINNINKKLFVFEDYANNYNLKI